MRNSSARRYMNVVFGRPAVFLLLFLTAATALFSAAPSYSKYVIRISPYTIAVGSSDTFKITAIAAINGTPQVGQTLTAGALTPADATATYQWQKCRTPNGTYTDICGADSSSYSLTPNDYNYFIKVTAIGAGSYTGTVTSEYIGPIEEDPFTPITKIGAIQGTLKYNQVLTAGLLTPCCATATYQWMSSPTLDGIYTDIPGATSDTYRLTAADIGRCIKVVATGSGSYSGRVESVPRGPVAAIPLTGIGAIYGNATVGQTLSAGSVTPYDAAVTYQWKRCSKSGGTYTNIDGATSSTYTLTCADYNNYIKVAVTGTDGYSGTVTSSYRGRIAGAPISGVISIDGKAKVGHTLKAITDLVSPPEAVYTYQWMKSYSPIGPFSKISGATSSTYKLTSNDRYYYIYVKITCVSSSGYTGSLSSTPIGYVAN